MLAWNSEAWAVDAWAIDAWLTESTQAWTNSAWADVAWQDRVWLGLSNASVWADATWENAALAVGSWANLGSGTVSLPPTVSLRVSFDTPLSVLTAGNVQKFHVLVRKSGVADPWVSVSLYEAGEEKTPIVSMQPVTSAIGQVVTALWDSSTLSDPAGSGVECYVLGTENEGSQIEIGAIAWDARIH